MRKIWSQLTAAFLCAILALVGMQAYLTKTYSHETRSLRALHGTQLYGTGMQSELWAYAVREDMVRSTKAPGSPPGEHANLERGSEIEQPNGRQYEAANFDFDGASEVKDIDVRAQDMTGEATEEKVAEQDEGDLRPTESNLELCLEYPPELVGNLTVNATLVPTEQQAIAAAGEILKDGCFEPLHCKPRQTVAIIVPYKNRWQHLIKLMHHLHPILQRQSIRYCVFVAEQFDNGSFNKARVMNAAFLEITRNHRFRFECAIFHDVDMLVENDKNLHVCSEMPRHLSPAIDKFNYSLNYGTKFGGVTAITVEHYKKVNGHGNEFWGWGGEDNDMEVRIAKNNLTISPVSKDVGRYKMIPHDHPWWFSPLYGVGSYLTSKTHWKAKKAGQSGLSDIYYNVRSKTYHKLWTKLTLDIRTVLVEKATVRFYGYNAGTLEFISPSQKTEDVNSPVDPSSPAGMFKAQKCLYERYTGKTVNKTLGMLQKKTYGRMYSTLEQAQKECDALGTYCGSIVEEHQGRFSLRSTAYMHENELRYRTGMLKQYEMTETHKTLSVHVKICPGDTAYLNIFKTPVVLAGDLQGPSPAYYVEMKIRIFYEVNKTIYYDTDVMTAHKAVMQEKVDSGVLESGIWDTLGNVYSSRLKILNTSDPVSVRKTLPESFHSVTELLNKGDGTMTLKTPLVGILRNPGCYVCKSQLTDETGAVLMQWKWWFELRAKTKDIEEQILNQQLEKARLTSMDFAESVQKRREMLIKYHEKMRSKVSPKHEDLPSDVQTIIRENAPPKQIH